MREVRARERAAGGLRPRVLKPMGTYPVVLASASPRRRALLAQLVLEFEVVPADVDEDALTLADPWKTAQKLAEVKAAAVAARRPDALVIAGDTVVAVPEGDGYRQLGKPQDPADAERMLSALSGREHVVVTGVALVWPGGEAAFPETTRVRFRVLTSEQIRGYVLTGEPMDKAGAYGAQGMASGFIERLDGSYTNVIGLPIEALEEALARLP